jgi:hypothetical protein
MRCTKCEPSTLLKLCCGIFMLAGDLSHVCYLTQQTWLPYGCRGSFVFAIGSPKSNFSVGEGCESVHVSAASSSSGCILLDLPRLNTVAGPFLAKQYKLASILRNSSHFNIACICEALALSGAGAFLRLSSGAHDRPLSRCAFLRERESLRPRSMTAAPSKAAKQASAA